MEAKLSEKEGKIGAKNRRAILDVATEVFAQKGFDGTRMTDISKATGLPKANLYYYFSTKEDIYRTVISNLIHSWDDALTSISYDREPADAFRAYIRAKLEFSRLFPNHSRLFATEILRGAGFLTVADKKHIRTVTEDHAAVIQHWIDEGKIRAVDPIHLLISIWSTAEFYADYEPTVRIVLNKRRLTKADFELAAQTMETVLLSGLLIEEVAIQ